MTPEQRKALDADLAPIQNAFWELDDLADNARKLSLIDLSGGNEIYKPDILMVYSTMPSLLVIKLSALIDDLVNVLWNHHFPEVKARDVHMDVRLKLLARQHHDLNRETIIALRQLRHECAHQLRKHATWEHVDKHMLDMVGVVLLI